MPDTGEERSRAELADESFSPPVTSSELVFEGRVWDVRRESVDYNGGEIVRDFVDHTGAVGVLAMDDDGRVMLIRQYRHPVRTRDWEIPAGLLDVAGESKLAAAQRELAEEVDLGARTWNVLAEFFTSPGGSSEVIRVFLARDVHPVTHDFTREGEEADMEKRWVPLDEVVDAALAGRIRNAPLIIAALAARAAGEDGFAHLAPAS
ncbi:NUDIX hydrolase [Glaciibacter flavus]|uniref:NUDIX hydrolase n=1 Tax=Orlajensenia flava TaxID=2565934 RepID=A0A4S4FZR6_9MICO|nr:NUDIX hydrolase [Glaciibacter flavus]THG36363.1 NUDIX hydrolase [Glaciibacter flavus]